MECIGLFLANCSYTYQGYSPDFVGNIAKPVKNSPKLIKIRVIPTYLSATEASISMRLSATLAFISMMQMYEIL